MLGGITDLPITLPFYDKEKLVFGGSNSFSGLKQTSSTLPSVISLVVGVIHSGWLYKTGRINTAAKQRWFVVKDRTLYYFQKKEVTREATVYGSIPLQGSQLSVTGDSTSFALIAPDRVWNLRAQSQEEMREWVRVLREQILGQVARFDEDDDESPEQLQKRELAKKQFSEGVLGNQPTSASISVTNVMVDREGVEGGGFGDMLVGGSSADEYQYNTDSNSASYSSKGSSASSTGRYFERVGLLPPEDYEAKSPRMTLDSDTDDLDEDERASLLANESYSGGSPARKISSPARSVNNQQRQFAEPPPDRETEDDPDCCCCVL
jgi:hypothetical protein